jgi:hypothetical protein
MVFNEIDAAHEFQWNLHSSWVSMKLTQLWVSMKLTLLMSFNEVDTAHEF